MFGIVNIKNSAEISWSKSKIIKVPRSIKKCVESICCNIFPLCSKVSNYD